MAIGVCRLDEGKRILELRRGALWQGFGFKDEEAFENDPKKPCYVPELSDKAYTRDDFLLLCDHQMAIARKIFYQLDWQCLETLLDEELREGELTLCPVCGRMFESYWSTRCPHCGNS